MSFPTISYPQLPTFSIAVKDLDLENTSLQTRNLAARTIENSGSYAKNRLRTPGGPMKPQTSYFLATGEQWIVENFSEKPLDLNTSLHIAVIGGDIEKIKDLVEKGAEVNSTIFKNLTPLHFAAMRCHLHAFIALAKSGANL
jgi:hypothetical protein